MEEMKPRPEDFFHLFRFHMMSSDMPYISFVPFKFKSAHLDIRSVYMDMTSITTNDWPSKTGLQFDPFLTSKFKSDTVTVLGNFGNFWLWLTKGLLDY